MKKQFLLFFLFLYLCSSAQIPTSITGTPIDHLPGQILLHLYPGSNFSEVLAEINAGQKENAQLFFLKTVFAEWNLYVVGFDETRNEASTMLVRCQRHPAVLSARCNRRAQERYQPNDAFWTRQKDMVQIGADRAWEVSQSGLTAQGDTIVVAVLEQGAYRDHPDLMPNLWVNWREIPENGIDDDQNGYVDDYRGFNAVDNQGDAPGYVGLHTAAVTGIIGAKGNNKLGVTGVNQTVKLLNIAIPGLAESDILTAYAYCYQLRKRYNDTQGKEGAFIVATNASFGIDGASPHDYADWCNMYDLLGSAGILNVVATTNQEVQVDSTGDVPSGCGSEFVMSVSNVNQADERQPSGYSPLSIDLAAPGTGTLSTGLGEGYTNLIGGCSAAAPHVTGGIALLYSIACDSLSADAQTNPPACARRLREALLSTVQKIPALAAVTATGGRLDLGAAADRLLLHCGYPRLPLEIVSVSPNPAKEVLNIRYSAPENNPGERLLRIFDGFGRLMCEKNIIYSPFTPYTLPIDVSFWPAGAYILVLGKEAKRFLIGSHR